MSIEAHNPRRCAQCSDESCIYSGVPCMCVCHVDFERHLMRNAQQRRMNERCSDCRYQPVTCARGLCYCECHGDRPWVRNPEQVVHAGHTQEGTEQGFAHRKIKAPVEPDAKQLVRLRDEYHAGTHPEWTIGGSDADDLPTM